MLRAWVLKHFSFAGQVQIHGKSLGHPVMGFWTLGAHEAPDSGPGWTVSLQAAPSCPSYPKGGLFLSEKVATSLENAKSSEVPWSPDLVLVGENSCKSTINKQNIYYSHASNHYLSSASNCANVFYGGNPHYNSVGWDHYSRVYYKRRHLGSEMEVICLSTHSRSGTTMRRGRHFS